MLSALLLEDGLDIYKKELPQLNLTSYSSVYEAAQLL